MNKNEANAWTEAIAASNADQAEEQVQQEATTEEVEQAQEEVIEQTEEVQEEVQQEEERTEEEEQIVTENEEEEDVLIFGDDDEETATAENTPTFTAEVAEKIKTEVGIEITSQQQLVETLKQLKDKADKADNIFASEEIKAANEILKQGGNWQEYLQISNTDWDAIADDQLVMWQLETEFQDKEEAQQAYDEMPDILRKREAKRIRNEQKLIQSEQKAQIVEKARRAQDTFVSGVKSALAELDMVGKVKVNDKAKAKLEKLVLTYDDKLRANEMQKKYFLNEKGEPDFKKMMQSIAKLEFYEKIEEVALKQGKTIGKREVIEKVSNVNNPRQNQTVQDVAVRKPLSAYESVTQRLMKGEKIQGFN